MTLSEWLQSIGLNFTPILDGERHRCDRDGTKKDDIIWYKGSREILPSGKTWETLTVGDWTTGEKFYYPPRNGVKWSETDRVYFEKKQKEQSDAYEKEKSERQEKTSLEAKKIWDAGNPASAEHAYLKKKKITLDERFDIRQAGEALLIPCRDKDGKLWGIQKIWPDGTKRFLPGQRKSGTCFTFRGRNDEYVGICEGFATGASIFEATGHTTIVAFDASNLVRLANDIKDFGKRIIIFGDDDRWSSSGKNVGRDKAEEAAKNVGGVAIFPKFVNTLRNETDFNDVHCLEGLESVRRQIERARGRNANSDERNEGVSDNTKQNGQSDTGDGGTNAEGSGKKEGGTESGSGSVKEYVNFLGHYKDEYFYTSSSNKQIVSIPRASHSDLALCDLMPHDYWLSTFPKMHKDGYVVGVNWKTAAYSMMERCRNSGIFNPEKVRGSGCWMDEGKFILHLGDKIIVDKREYKVGEYKSKFIYELGSSLPPPTKELTKDEATDLITAISVLKWRSQDDAMYFAGWLMISRVCGALNWRPHIWLTGPSGSGKSTVIDGLVKKIAGDWAITPVGTSTEAGIRQNIGNDSRPVIFDEAETNNKKSSNKIQNILELIRQASSNTDSKIMKGTADQSGLQFKINSIFLLSSIRVNLTEEADKNRFTICELLRNDPNDWEFVQEKINRVTDDFGDKVFARAINHFDTLVKNKTTVANEIAKIHNQRIGQQYGTLIAGYLLLNGTELISEKAAEELVKSLNISNKEILEIEEDEHECINHLFMTKVRVVDTDNKAFDLAFGDLVDRCIQEVPAGVHYYRNQLALFGVGISRDGAFLKVASVHPELGKLFSDTKWHNGLWRRALSRINGSVSKKMKLSGSTVWGTRIPLSSVLGTSG